MKQKYEKIYHVSDTDMDGYVSQYLFSLTGHKDVMYFNPKRNDMGEAFNLIFNDVVKHKDKKILLLITDFSLEEQWVKRLNNFKRGNKNIDIEYQLLDHHKTGEKIAKENEWYHFNNERCSALLTAHYVINNYVDETDDIKIKEDILFIGEFVDAYDRWIQDHPYFYQSNFVNEVIMGESRYPKAIQNHQDLRRDAIFHLIKSYILYFKKDDANIYELEKSKIDVTMSYLKGKIPDVVLEDKNISIFQKQCKHYAEEYLKNEKEYPTVMIDNVPFKVFYEVTGNLYQYMSSYYLDEAKEADATISVGKNGRCSLRTRKDNISVREIAEKHFNGGGHDGAAGGEFLESLEVNSEAEVIKLLKKKFKTRKLNKNQNPQ